MIDTIISYLPLFGEGFVVTLQLWVSTSVIGTILGFLIALCRLSRNRLISAPALTFVELVRGLPPLLQLFFVYFSLAEWGITIPGMVAAVGALSLYSAAYTSEVLRGGILSVPVGQSEAAQSIGLNYVKTYRRVILPQALRLSLPPMTNQLIVNLKMTSLAVVIAVPEVMYVSMTGASATFQAALFYSMAGVIYLAMILPLSAINRRLERTAASQSRRVPKKRLRALRIAADH